MIHEALICQDTDGLPEIRIDADHDGTYEKPVTAGYRQKTINEIINRNHQRDNRRFCRACPLFFLKEYEMISEYRVSRYRQNLKAGQRPCTAFIDISAREKAQSRVFLQGRTIWLNFQSTCLRAFWMRRSAAAIRSLQT
jgi:hypothetical protein